MLTFGCDQRNERLLGDCSLIAESSGDWSKDVAIFVAAYREPLAFETGAKDVETPTKKVLATGLLAFIDWSGDIGSQRNISVTFLN